MVGMTTQMPPNRMIGVALGPSTTAEAIAGFVVLHARPT